EDPPQSDFLSVSGLGIGETRNWGKIGIVVIKGENFLKVALVRSMLSAQEMMAVFWSVCFVCCWVVAMLNSWLCLMDKNVPCWGSKGCCWDDDVLDSYACLVVVGSSCLLTISVWVAVYWSRSTTSVDVRSTNSLVVWEMYLL
ncbi:16771_t:CDS:2, partial [Dentiscutata erythropus]